jgi:hypothetical protein
MNTVKSIKCEKHGNEFNLLEEVPEGDSYLLEITNIVVEGEYRVKNIGGDYKFMDFVNMIEFKKTKEEEVDFEDISLEAAIDMFINFDPNASLFNNVPNPNNITINMKTEYEKKTKKNKTKTVKSEGIYQQIIKVNTMNIKRYEGREIVIKGHIQSGKSRMMVNGALKFFGKGLSSLIVLRNSNDDAVQLINRMKTIIEELKVFLPKRYKNIEIKVVENIKKAEIVNGGKPTICVTIANSATLKKYLNIIETKPNLQKKFVVFEDEKDFIDSANTTTRDMLQTVRSFCYCSFGVSATIMDTMFDYAIESGNVWVMTPPEDYKGLNRMIHCNLEHEAKYCTHKVDDVTKRDKNFVGFFDKFATEKISTDYQDGSWTKEWMPRTCLFRVANTHDANKRVLSYVAHKYTIPAIYYSGGGKVILSLPSRTSRMRLSNGSRSSLTTIKADDGSSFNGKFHVFDNANAGLVLQWLYENGGVKKFDRIAVFAGNMATRSISFGADNYKWCHENNKLWWHLTDEYMLVSDGMKQPELLQVFGRLAVIAKDSVPLRCHGTKQTLIDLHKAYNIQEELIGRAKVTSRGRTMGIAISDLGILADKLGKRKMTRKTKYTLNKVKKVRDEGEGAWGMKEYTHELVEESKCGEPEESKGEEENKEEFNRLTNKMFPKWANTHTKIARFMKNLDPYKLYKKDEYKEIADNIGFNFNISQFLKKNVGTNGYGSLLQKNGRRYKLRDELVNSFVEHFNYSK